MQMKWSLLFIMIVVFLPINCSDQNEQFDLLKEELKNIDKRLKTIEVKIDVSGIDFEKKKGPDREALNKISFPRKQDKKSIRENVSKILSVSRTQSTFTSSDPQIEMLARVGEKNLDILLDSIGLIPFLGSYHLNNAIMRIASDKSREKVLNLLPQNKDLIEVVLKKGWHWEIKELLVRKLHEPNDYLPDGWIRAVSLFQDPDTYEALIHFMINGNSKYRTYEIIKDLPGIELKDALFKAWDKVENKYKFWEGISLATVIISYGRKDVLEVLLNSLKKEDSYYFYGIVVSVLYRHVDFKGSIDEMISWYKSNEERLIFDEKDQKFKIK